MTSDEEYMFVIGGGEFDDKDYDPRFTEFDLHYLKKVDFVPPSFARKFKRLSGKTIGWLYNYCNLEDEEIAIVDEFPPGFPGQALKWALKGNVRYADVEKYAELCSSAKPPMDPMSLVALSAEGILPQEALRWWPYFNGSGNHIANAVKRGITLEKVLSYPYPDYTFQDIINFVMEGVPGGRVQLYTNRAEYLNLTPEELESPVAKTCFNGSCVITLEKLGVPIEETRAWDYFFLRNRGKVTNGREIGILYNSGITIEKFKSFSKNSRDFHLAFIDMQKYVEGKGFDVIKVIGTGSTGLVALEEKTRFAKKFASRSGYKEYHLLRKVYAACKGAQTNVIKASQNPFFEENTIDEFCEKVNVNKGHCCFDIEYIEGDSLEIILDKKGKLSPGRVLAYGSGVFNGLSEIASAGIYHRDIRPSNVMVEDGTGRAVIIDLGIATDEPDAMPQDNRRYGGSDLMSLGQLMYKMATGNNLFNEHISDEVYNRSLDWAGEIEQLRKNFCYDKHMQETYFSKVDSAIDSSEGGLKLKDAIKTCLKAGLEVGEQQNLTPKDVRERAYAQVNEMFQRYAS